MAGKGRRWGARGTAARGAGSGAARGARTGAHANDDKRLWLLRSVLVALRITKFAHADGGGLLDLLLGARADKDGLATPLDNHAVARLQGAYVHLERGQGHDVGGGVQRGEDLDHQEAAGRGPEEARAACERRRESTARRA